ncbi:DNA-3-methyladenine glycosylase family protein [Neobacillus jeddahensis]|uniref:DNA-3-methyladenine glycosylase family protein n=1 Tax=Neobacillus jeddahensis TaxID=1461580 RepID=UPI00058E366D|nr:DNA-3-methyladenine glycosylase [Neobacillus jeddahensis]
MNWQDHETYIEIFPPREFNFQECIVFLSRSEQEVLHQIIDGTLYKAIPVEDAFILFKITGSRHVLRIDFPIEPPAPEIRSQVAFYIWGWFDLDTNLRHFYELASTDPILRSVVENYAGLRIIGVPDIFEALTWAIIGQQINLTFAYTLKKRFVEQFGECLTFEGSTFWVYPSYNKIAEIKVDELRELQFSVRKAEYVIGVAQAMSKGELTKEGFLQQGDYLQIKKSLMAIRGIGAWSADYVLMKCLHETAAFPIADVGLHNALKFQLGIERKPTLAEIAELAKNWEGWQAYATFYLWRSLYNDIT